jgi:hypothetical protein
MIGNYPSAAPVNSLYNNLTTVLLYYYFLVILYSPLEISLLFHLILVSLVHLLNNPMILLSTSVLFDRFLYTNEHLSMDNSSTTLPRMQVLKNF